MFVCSFTYGAIFATCDMRLIVDCYCSFCCRVNYDLRLIVGRKSKVVVRFDFDVARLIAQPIVGPDSNCPKKQQLKFKKNLIARLVAGYRSQVARHIDEHNLSCGSHV